MTIKLTHRGSPLYSSTGHRITLRGYRIDKNGRIVKSNAHKDVSARIRERSSKKVRVARRGDA